MGREERIGGSSPPASALPRPATAGGGAGVAASEREALARRYDSLVAYPAPQAPDTPPARTPGGLADAAAAAAAPANPVRTAVG